MSEITKDACELLYTLCKEYSNRRNAGVPKSRAKEFLSAKSIQTNFCPETFLEDVEENLRELGRNGYLSNLYADNTVVFVMLRDKAIAMSESIKKDTILSVADFISKFLPW